MTDQSHTQWVPIRYGDDMTNPTSPTERTPTMVIIQPPTRVVGYVRVSTDEQAASGLGLDAQVDTITRAVAARGWQLVGVCVDAGVSGKVRPADRVGFGEALGMVRGGSADVVMVAKLDRLARSMIGLAEVLTEAATRRWGLVLLDVDLDLTTPNGALMANIQGAVAQWERDIISERTRAAMQAAKRRGCRLGRPVEVPDTTRAMVCQLRAKGWTMAKIADHLTGEGIPTARGGTWHPSTVARVLRSVDLDAEAAELAAEHTTVANHG